MKEVCHLKAEMKAKKVEEVERWGAKQKESMRHIAEYEEELENTNINDMPIPAGKPSVYSEATPVPQKQRTYALPDISLSEGGEMDEEQTVCLESEVTNLNNGDYGDREEDEDMSSAMERVNSVTKNGGKSKKHIIEVPDSC